MSGPVATTADSGTVRFMPHARFFMGVVLQNTSHTRVVVKTVRVIEPPRTLIHQVGTDFQRFQPRRCPRGVHCPAPTFPIGSAKNLHPHPYTVAPGKLVGVDLGFRLGSCSAVPGANPAPISRVSVTFRRADGSMHKQTLDLDGAAFHLLMPTPEDCTFPRSNLTVNSNYPLTTDVYFTYRGSKGDVCVRTRSGLSFRSRAMKNDDGRPERIEIRVPHFSGTGAYYRAHATIVVGRKRVFRHGARLIVTRATSTEVFAQVRVHRLRHPRFDGLPYSIYGAMRCRVRG
jgi:hypothetical protein